MKKLIYNENEVAITDFETAKKDLKITDYCISLLNEFELDKVYLTSESIGYLILPYALEHLDNQTKDEDYSFKTKFTSENYTFIDKNKKEVETAICITTFMLSNNVHIELNKNRINTPIILDEILSVVHTSKNKKVKVKILVGSIKYFNSIIENNIKFSSLIKHLEDNLKEIQKQNKPLLIQGKKLNITERYEITNKLLNVYNTLNTLNVSATEKHKLLSIIMGCNQQTARELFNGTQQKRTPIREDLINDYINNLK